MERKMATGLHPRVAHAHQYTNHGRWQPNSSLGWLSPALRLRPGRGHPHAFGSILKQRPASWIKLGWGRGQSVGAHSSAEVDVAAILTHALHPPDP